MITINLAHRDSIRLDSEKYSWMVDGEGDLKILNKETQECVGRFVTGSWWSVVDFDVLPKNNMYPNTNITYPTTNVPIVYDSNTDKIVGA